MKRIYHKSIIAAAVSDSRYGLIFEELKVDPFLIRYEPGEFVVGPGITDQLILIIVEGTLTLYYIRDDGSRFSLTVLEKDAIIGESHLFDTTVPEIYAEAVGPVTCLAVDVRSSREKLLNSAPFLRVIAKMQAQKIEAIARQDAAHSTLKERVLTYIRYKCPDHVLRGVESTAFHMRCSPRQLQRILNEYEKEGVLRKLGKGVYAE